MARRTDPETERTIYEMDDRGMAPSSIASALGKHERTIRRILERKPTSAPPELRALDAEPMSAAELATRARHARDTLAEALPQLLARLVENTATNRPSKDAAGALTCAVRDLKELDAYCQLQAIVSTPVENREDQEQRYVALLTHLAGSGSVPAARALGRAWGCDEVAERGVVEVVWAADLGDDETDPEPVDGSPRND